MKAIAVFTSDPPDVWVDICPENPRASDVFRQLEGESSAEALRRRGWQPVGLFKRVAEDQLVVAVESLQPPFRLIDPIVCGKVVRRPRGPVYLVFVGDTLVSERETTVQHAEDDAFHMGTSRAS